MNYTETNAFLGFLFRGSKINLVLFIYPKVNDPLLGTDFAYPCKTTLSYTFMHHIFAYDVTCIEKYCFTKFLNKLNLKKKKDFHNPNMTK